MPWLRDFAWGLLVGEHLEDKLAPLPGVLVSATDGLRDDRGVLRDAVSTLRDDPSAPPLRLAGPGRAPRLALRPGREARTPPLAGMADPEQRARILHAFANHELQAVELFAWALLAFPVAPPAFRRGLLETLVDEQRHLQLYLERLAAHGRAFGDFPLSGYFWGKLEHLRTPLDFVCAMGLTFEQRNLDHTLDFAAAADECGDLETAAVLRRVHADEIRHVRFARTWLADFKPPHLPAHEAWAGNLRWPLRPAQARGPQVHEACRRAAGLDDGFLALLAADTP